MNETGKVSFWYSWPVIIIAFIVFWPVAVFLIIKRISVDKRTAMRAAKLLNGLGITLYVITVLGFIGCFTEGFDMDVIIGLVFFGVAGYALRRVARKSRKEAESVKKYLSVIVNGGVHQLDAIASATGNSYEVVHEDINKMIEKGYLKNAYIDEGIREIVLSNSAPAVQSNINNVAANTAPVYTESVQTRIVACPCCGANNTVSGALGECEYCGSPLK